MVGDMPDRNDRNTQFGVRPGVTAFHPVERIFRRECGEDIVGVVEGILEILDQLGFGFSPNRARPFLSQSWGGFFILKFVEKGQLGAKVRSSSFHLLQPTWNRFFGHLVLVFLFRVRTRL
jgi:hypothetical protein